MVTRSTLRCVAFLAAGAFAASLPSPAPAHSLRGPAAIRSWMAPAVKSASALLYVASEVAGTIDVFAIAKTRATLVGQIADNNGPTGITTDAAGNLYVTDIGVPQEGPVPGDIAVYPKGAITPSRFIVPPDWVPTDISVGRDGTLYVANIAPVNGFSPGSVSIYAPNANRPERILTFPNFQVSGVVIDERNDLFVAYDSGQGGRIKRFAHARQPGVDLGVNYGTPWGIIEDVAGNLVASDGNGPLQIFSEAGKQLGAIAVPGAPSYAAFSTDGKLVYVSNFGNFDVEIFTYPAGNLLGTVHSPEWQKNAWPTGVAYWPSAPK